MSSVSNQPLPNQDYEELINNIYEKIANVVKYSNEAVEQISDKNAILKDKIKEVLTIITDAERRSFPYRFFDIFQANTSKLITFFDEILQNVNNQNDAIAITDAITKVKNEITVTQNAIQTVQEKKEKKERYINPKKLAPTPPEKTKQETELNLIDLESAVNEMNAYVDNIPEVKKAKETAEASSQLPSPPSEESSLPQPQEESKQQRELNSENIEKHRKESEESESESEREKNEESESENEDHKQPRKSRNEVANEAEIYNELANKGNFEDGNILSDHNKSIVRDLLNDEDQIIEYLYRFYYYLIGIDVIGRTEKMDNKFNQYRKKIKATPKIPLMVYTYFVTDYDDPNIADAVRTFTIEVIKQQH